MKTKLISLLFCLSFLVLNAEAQEWMRVHHEYGGTDWRIPLEIKKYRQFDINSRKDMLRAYSLKADSTEMVVPFLMSDIDSIDFAYDLTDDEKGHNKYRPFSMHITTEDYANIVERELWLNCHISIDGKGEYSDYSGTGRIRGRGNSSWDWYDKKPYKFKLDEKSKLLGLEKARNWNLLANYRDVTDMMNVYAFEAARFMGMPHTNHTRFVEVFLNDEYIGIYQLTEKLEVGKNRVNIDEEGGVMLSFDKDDGPSLSPSATDNFNSKVYGLPMCVKHPEDPTYEQIVQIRDDFAKVETAVKNRDYKTLGELMDIPSYIAMLQMHEYLFNVEIGAPRSMYMFKDKDGKYTFGPVWDWDAAFDFQWSDMYTGHTYFNDYRKLVLGSDPVKGTNEYERINMFWRNMFGNADFVAQYKETWNALSDSINNKCWDEMIKYFNALMDEGSTARDQERWPLVKNQGNWWSGTSYFKPDEEITKMRKWLDNRKDYLDVIFNNYPAGDNAVIEDGEKSLVNIVKITQTCQASKGYSQSGKITIDKSEVDDYLGGAPTSLVPLNADGKEGKNTAAGTYGAWFSPDGSTIDYYSDSHVYIESNDLYSWSYGCHPKNCESGHSHTVTMQYSRGKKAVNVKVTFNIK